MPEFKVETQKLPVYFDDNGEPIAILFYKANRDRVLYVVKPADEEEHIALFERKNTKVKAKTEPKTD